MLDELVLLLQRGVDGLTGRLRLGAPDGARRRRLLIIQIDGLSRSVLEQGIAAGAMPCLAGLLRQGVYRIQPMSVGMPTCTPAFQLAAMSGVKPDIPGFHYHDKRRREDVHFPRAGHAALIEETQALLRLTSAFIVLVWVVAKGLGRTLAELVRFVPRLFARPSTIRIDARWLAIRLGISVWIRELFTLAVSRDLYAGIPWPPTPSDLAATARSSPCARWTARSGRCTGCSGASGSTGTRCSSCRTTARRSPLTIRR